ncbi:hypothetical protein GCM10022243_44130 [Saccharothrix violaceirubra]|uniref:Lycopene beta-cyclase n=1 Tax=Saccharothrix violaceirubra TaxID=413306 RepID=A0A7W7WVM7_9PSEU|nr:lycopene cyclase family protein [Saccharothrix violaceirubra]MBB4964698.1 lycopene beta-cyclase [Saccharothrix violaceirubra]
MDVLVVGGGPAGRALARACVGRGLDTALVDPAPARPWRATYAAWSDELPADARTRSESRAVVVATRRHDLDRGYAVLDDRWLRDLDGVRVLTGRVVGRTPTTACLADGSVLGAGAVVYAGGTRGHVHQTAIGVVVGARAARPFVADGEALVMDWRRPPDAGTPDPTFLYAVPLGDDRVLLEETSLARRPGLPAAELRRRLRSRLAAHRIAVPDGEERVRFPLDVPPGDGFGATAGFVHPATGYSVAASLRLAPVAADALVSGVPVERAMWPYRAKAVHALHRFGLDAVLALRPHQVPEFFDEFFDLPATFQRSYLSDRTDLRGTVAAMSGLFRSAKWSLRARLAFPVRSAKVVRTAG